jgi:hypothetical protein
MMLAENQTHLICQGQTPIIGTGIVRDEMIIYNITGDSRADLLRTFEDITGRQITYLSDASELSGGQKVLLMCLMALFSPASFLDFFDVERSLDENNRSAIEALARSFGNSKTISWHKTNA